MDRIGKCRFRQLLAQVPRPWRGTGRELRLILWNQAERYNDIVVGGMSLDPMLSTPAKAHIHNNLKPFETMGVWGKEMF